MRGWLDARNNDLKSASDPADLVNKINNRDNQASLNKNPLDRFAMADAIYTRNNSDLGFYGGDDGTTRDILRELDRDIPTTKEQAYDDHKAIVNYLITQNDYPLTDQMEAMLTALYDEDNKNSKELIDNIKNKNYDNEEDLQNALLDAIEDEFKKLNYDYWD